MMGRNKSQDQPSDQIPVTIVYDHRLPVWEYLEAQLSDLAINQGLDDSAAQRHAADICGRIRDWPYFVVDQINHGMRSSVAPHLAYLMYFGVLGRNSPLATGEVIEALETTPRSNEPIAARIGQEACMGDFHSHWHMKRGITDAETLRWASQLFKLPVGVWLALKHSSSPKNFFTILHHLGISDRGLPTDGDYGEPPVDLKEPLTPDDDPLASIRRSLWLLHDGRDQPDAVTHAQVEGVIGRLAHHAPGALRTLARWANSFEPDVVSTLLVFIGAAELGGPFASQPSVADMFGIALVNFSRGRRDGTALAHLGIFHGLHVDDDARDRYVEQREDIGRRVYNEFPVTLRWIIDAILGDSNACAHLLVLVGYIELAPDSPVYLPPTYEDED